MTMRNKYLVQNFVAYYFEILRQILTQIIKCRFLTQTHFCNT